MAETHKLIDVEKGYHVARGSFGGWIVAEKPPGQGYMSGGEAAFSTAEELVRYLGQAHANAAALREDPTQ